MLTLSTLYEIKHVEVPDIPMEDIASKSLDYICQMLPKYEFVQINSIPADTSAVPVINILFQVKGNKRSMLVTALKHMITMDFNEYETADGSGYRRDAEKIHKDLSANLPQCDIKRTCALVRGRDYWRYTEFCDRRIQEYDFSKIIFDTKSQYQRVTIAKSDMFDNVLLLDGVDNISEAHDLYTPSLLGIKHGYDYKDKTILILGGGDGAALNYLRKLSPKMITMVEIDEVVLQACKKHLRKCCEDSLDNYSGENYEVIVGDCLDYLQKYADEGHKFDFIISDITDIPIEEKMKDKQDQTFQVFFSEVHKCGANFFRTVFNLSLKVLKQEGTILTHVCASGSQQGLQNFKSEVNSLNEVLSMNIEHEYIPTFSESWAFCQMKRAIVG